MCALPRMRSILFAPASRPDVLEKLPRSDPDAVVIDLEDAVPADGKQAARRPCAGGRGAPRARTSRVGGARTGQRGVVTLVANQVFSPSAEERDWALRLLAAYERAELAGEAAIVFDGEMVDEPMARRARAILAAAGMKRTPQETL